MSYKILPTSTRSMPLEVDPTTFTKEYAACWKDKSRSTDKLFDMARPFLVHWEQMLTDPDYPRDINYVSMCGRLRYTGQPTELIAQWVAHQQEHSSVLHELEFLFLIQLRAFRYSPGVAMPRMAEYVIAQNFRDRLKDKIKLLKKNLEVPTEVINFPVEDSHPDHLFIKNLDLSQWDKHLLKLLRLGIGSTEGYQYTHFNRRYYISKEKQLWHLLRAKWNQT